MSLVLSNPNFRGRSPAKVLYAQAYFTQGWYKHPNDQALGCQVPSAAATISTGYHRLHHRAAVPLIQYLAVLPASVEWESCTWSVLHVSSLSYYELPCSKCSQLRSDH